MFAQKRKLLRLLLSIILILHFDDKTHALIGSALYTEPIVSDLEICLTKVKSVLSEYGCSIISQDDWTGILIRDNDTHEECGFNQ